MNFVTHCMNILKNINILCQLETQYISIIIQFTALFFAQVLSIILLCITKNTWVGNFKFFDGRKSGAPEPLLINFACIKNT